MKALLVRIGRSLLATLVFGALSLVVLQVYTYVEMSDKARADFWFEARNRFQRGTVQHLWVLERAIEADSTLAQAYLDKAMALNRKGLYGEGFGALKQAVDLNPAAYLPYSAHVKLYMLRDFEGALEDLIRLDSLTPNFRDVISGEDLYHVMGLAYRGMEDHEQALKYFHRSIDEITEEIGYKSVHVKTYFYCALTEQALGKKGDALANFDKALGLFSKYTEAYYYKGLLLQELGEFDKACLAFNAAEQFFNKGYLYTSSYFEPLDPVYFSDIELVLSNSCSDN